MIAPNIKKIIALSLQEDIGTGDITTAAVVDPKLRVQADVWIKSGGVCCGLPMVQDVFRQVDKTLSFRPLVKEGQQVKANTIVAHVYGKAASIVTAERVALNFLSLLSGIATTTKKYVDAITPYKTHILDTRKTLPTLRVLQRYAVACGGGYNHRFNLADMGMIKDNHRLLAKDKGIKLMVALFRQRYPTKKIELEIDDLSDLNEALKSGAQVVLLDNMSPKNVATAVAIRKKLRRNILLEASGGITLSNIRRYAATGVDRISIGAITHQLNSLDVSLEVKYCA